MSSTNAWKRLKHRLQTIRDHFASVSDTDSSRCGKAFTNWAEIHTCCPSEWYSPHSIEEIVHIVRDIRRTNPGAIVRVVGSGHSPNDACCVSSVSGDNGGGVLISLDNMRRILHVDVSKRRVWVEAGITLQELHDVLWEKGLSIFNLGSISEQTLAGAIATGTHGTGEKFGMLATHVKGFTLVDGIGRVIQVSSDSNQILIDGMVSTLENITSIELIAALRCHLGALGVVAVVEIECDRVFFLDASQRMNTVSNLFSQLDRLVRSQDHFRFWWIPHSNKVIEWSARRIYPTPKHDVSRALIPRKSSYFQDLIIGKHFYELCLYISSYIPQLVPFLNRGFSSLFFNRPGRELDRSYRVFNFDCLFRQYVNEWSIPFENTVPALQALENIISKKKLKVHFPVEVRTVAADDSLIGPCRGRLSTYIGVIMYRPFNRDPPQVFEYFKEFEDIMKSFGGRPHWAKEFVLSPKEIDEMYPDTFHRFKEIRRVLDPNNLFFNKYLQRIFRETS